MQLQKKVEPLEKTGNRLKVISLIIVLWMAIVTVALTTVACVNYKRCRRERQESKACEEVDYDGMAQDNDGSVVERIEDLVGASETDDYEP